MRKFFARFPVANFLLAIPFYLPAVLRLSIDGLEGSVGFLSDVAVGSLFYILALISWRWLSLLLILFWALFESGSHELLVAMHRYATWQDLHFLMDPTFVENSAAGMQLSSPVWVALMVVAMLLAGCSLTACAKYPRFEKRTLQTGFGLALSLLVVQGVLSRSHEDAPIVDRYNPMHWFIKDAMAIPFRPDPALAKKVTLPPSFSHSSLNGTRLIQKGQAKNVLIVAMEGIPGIYYPEIRKSMDVAAPVFEMKQLAASTPNAMLVPDFVVHSHQTIRGLYAMLCGDISKLSTETPKAFEILNNPERAKDCLPAQMAKQGWSTHFLQGAGLAFMGKDRVMPAIGFQQVHGSEWFKEPDVIPFQWGQSDPGFFKGVRKYIADLQKKDKPWLLSLMTVGTHQPYAVSDEMLQQYPDRRIASVAVLDRAVAEFVEALKTDGVLDDTLVIITSDESHGSEVAEWVSSWGINIVLAPEQASLPRIKHGSYGLMDMEASIMDYLDLPLPASIFGQSFFRDYQTPRDMASFTGGKLRWHTAGNQRYECTFSEGCQLCEAPSLLGNKNPALCHRDETDQATKLFAMATQLDHLLQSTADTQVMQFASGEIRKLPQKISSEWTDNLIGAQYLDFPAQSKVHVVVRLKALESNTTDVQMQLNIRQWEKLTDIPQLSLPILKPGEETKLEFDVANPVRREAFSFHLFGSAENSQIQLQEFKVEIVKKAGA